MADRKRSISSGDESGSSHNHEARGKWKSAFGRIKERGFQMIRSSISPDGRRLSKQKSTASEEIKLQEEEIDPVYLALKEASSKYPKPTTTGRKSSIQYSSEDSGINSLSPHYSRLQHSSDPKLRPMNSFDDCDDNPPSPGLLRPPKLSLKMKSLSLDCPEASPPMHTGLLKKRRDGSSPRGRQRLHPSRALKPSGSVDTDNGTEKSSRSGSPCPSASPYTSTPDIPSSVHVTVHRYCQKFPEELDLRLGDRIVVTDSDDPDWFQGFKESDSTQRIGIFPTTCVAVMMTGERVLQVGQNLNLTNGAKNLRLFRDQVVFGQGEVNDNRMIMVRTAHHYKAMCPIDYLTYLD